MLKWHNIRIFYYINVLVYTLTMLVLSTYILLLHSGYEPEATRVKFYIIYNNNFVLNCLFFFLNKRSHWPFSGIRWCFS